MSGKQKKALSDDVDLTLQMFARAFKDDKFDAIRAEDVVEILSVATNLSVTRVNQEMKSRICRILEQENKNILKKFEIRRNAIATKENQNNKKNTKSNTKEMPEQTNINEIV